MKTEIKGGLFEILAKIKAKPGLYLGSSSLSDLFRACWKSIEPLSDNTFSHFGNDQVQGYGIWRLKIHALWWEIVD